MPEEPVEKLLPALPGMCGPAAHIFEWRSDLTADCPTTKKCFCGQSTYMTALQAMYRRVPPLVPGAATPAD